jgi:hypothetical protein
MAQSKEYTPHRERFLHGAHGHFIIFYVKCVIHLLAFGATKSSDYNEIFVRDRARAHLLESQANLSRHTATKAPIQNNKRR